MKSVFEKIIAHEIPAKIVYEDDLCIAFHDIAPQAPVHALLIPKTTDIERLSGARPRHQALLGHLMLKAGEVAAHLGLKDFRVVVNDGVSAGQSVWHLHLHILGGRPLSWPPG